MRPDDDAIPIFVTGEWNGWRSATTQLGHLRDVHWHQPQRAPHAMIHAHVSCGEIVGELSHVCDPTTAPHRVHVCVLKRHNIPSAYAELARRADRATHAAVRPRPANSSVSAGAGGW